MAQETEPNQQTEDEPRAGSTTLSKALASSLERMAKARASLPPEERNPPADPERAIEPYQGKLTGVTERRTLTDREMAQELLRLGTHFPAQNIGSKMEALKFQDFYSDLRHLTIEELRRACRCYRLDPKNEFFPTPGKLLAALKEG